MKLSSILDDEAISNLAHGLLAVPHVALWIKDAELRYVHVTPAWEAAAGLSREVVLGRRDEDFRPAELANRFQDMDRRVMATGRAETREERYETPRAVRTYSYTKFPLRDQTGAIVAVAGLMSETTDARVVAGVPLTDRELTSTVLGSMPEAIVRFTPGLVVTFANPAFALLYGRHDSALVGASLADIFAPAMVASLTTATLVLTEEQPQSVFERESVQYDGRHRWREWRLAGAFDEAGALVEVQAIGSDVTEQKRYQIALETLLDATGRGDAPFDVVLRDVLSIGLGYMETERAVFLQSRPDGRMSVTSIGEPEPDGETIRALRSIPLDVREPTAASDTTRHPGADPRVRTYIGQRVDVAGEPQAVLVFYSGAPRLVPFNAQAMMLQRIIARWIAIALERSRRHAELSRSRAELSLILDTVPAKVLTVDARGEVIIANSAARALPRPISSRAVDFEAFALEGLRTSRLERWDNGDNDPRWMQVERVVFTEADTGEERLLVVANDVTEAVEKEQALHKANEGLNQFAYIASHDLQEPLRKIGTFVDILIEGLTGGNADDVAYSTRVIKDSARRASALIRDLLAWSRLTNRPLERQPLAFAAVVREVLADVLSARPGSDLEVVDEMSDFTVSADSTHVRQLVENLLTNAIKYRHPDRAPRLSLRLTRSGGKHAVFEVEDNGIGFEQVHARQIFEPFRRLHNERDYTGTGVGLAICARVCEQHGWTIRARGRPGEGATFRVGM